MHEPTKKYVQNNSMFVIPILYSIYCSSDYLDLDSLIWFSHVNLVSTKHLD